MYGIMEQEYKGKGATLIKWVTVLTERYLARVWIKLCLRLWGQGAYEQPTYCNPYLLLKLYP